MATQIIIPRQLDANGDPVSGAKANVYETGTTTPVTVYTDTGLSVAHANPIVSDSAGYFAQAFYGGATALKVVVTTSADATLVTYDPAPLVSLSSSAAADVTFAATTEIPQTNVQAAIVAVEATIGTTAGTEDGAITTAKIADDAVTRAKIADAAMSGADATLITGTAGADGTIGAWNTDGDLVAGSAGGSQTLTQFRGGSGGAITGGGGGGVYGGSSTVFEYERVGDVVFVTFELTVASTAATGTVLVVEYLPYESTRILSAITRFYDDSASTWSDVRTVTSGSGATQSILIDLPASSVAVNDYFIVQMTYRTGDAL